MSQSGEDFVPSDEYEGDEAWKQKVSGLEMELFGGSSSSSDGEDGEVLSAAEEMESEHVTTDKEEITEEAKEPSDQTDLIRPPRKKRAKDKQDEVEQPQDEEMDERTRKKLEARQEFEAAMQKIKTKRSPKMTDSESTEFDDLAQTLKEQMIEAADMDNKSIALKQPALAKLKLMPQVSSLLASKFK